MGAHHDQLVRLLKETFGNKEIIGVEIGTKAGDLTITLLRDLPNLKLLFTIDPWRHFPGEGFEAGHGQEYHDRQQLMAKNRLGQEEYRHRCRILRLTSDEACEHIIPHPVDFVWIDGHHAYDQVRKDILNYSHFVRKGGVIGGHDYGLVEDVKRAVDEFFKGVEVNTGDDFTWWVVKQ